MEMTFEELISEDIMGEVCESAERFFDRVERYQSDEKYLNPTPFTESVMYESMQADVANIDKEISQIENWLNELDSNCSKAIKNVSKDQVVNIDKRKLLEMKQKFAKAFDDIKKNVLECAKEDWAGAKNAYSKAKEGKREHKEDVKSSENRRVKATKKWDAGKNIAIAAIQPIPIPTSSLVVEAGYALGELTRGFYQIAKNRGLTCLKEIRRQLARADYHEHQLQEGNKYNILKKFWHILWKTTHNCIAQANMLVRWVMKKHVAAKTYKIEVKRKTDPKSVKKYEKYKRYENDINDSYKASERTKARRQRKADKDYDELAHKVAGPVMQKQIKESADLLEGIDFFDI